MLFGLIQVAHAGVLADVPTPTDLIAGIGAVSSPWFDEMLPWMYLALGIIVVFGLLAFLPKILGRIFGHHN